jgi:cyanophycinase
MSEITCPLVGARLLVEGGGDDLPASALHQYCGWCSNYALTRGQENPYIVVIPWPSARTSQEVFEDYASDHWFGQQTAIVLKVSPSDKEIAEDPSSWAGFKELVSQSSGVWISGGDQNNIVNLFEKIHGLKQFLQGLYCAGLPFGGTSAGASIMSETMLTGEGGNGAADDEEKVLWNFITPKKVGIRSGLGLVANMVIDQHFLIRQRNNRLLSVMCEDDRTETFAIGVDEDCAVSIVDNHLLEVLGREDKVAVLFQRVGSSRDAYVTRLLHASPIQGRGAVIDLLTLPRYDENETGK